MAKLFIETYSGLKDGKLGSQPLVVNPSKGAYEMTIPTNSSTTSSIEFNFEERVIRVVPRANCRFYFKGWAKGASESSGTESPETALTENACEYFSIPERVGGWYNLKLFILNDNS